MQLGYDQAIVTLQNGGYSKWIQEMDALIILYSLSLGLHVSWSQPRAGPSRD
jgi:hypothetical protein